MAWQDDLTGADRDAYAALNQMFSSYGLQSLAPKILDYIRQGYDTNTVSLMLQDSNEYKQRFAGNEARKKAGLNVLSPAEYLQLENSYKSTMKAYSMPAGFYDTPDDFAQLMGHDISPDELRTRAQSAWQFTQAQNPATRQQLQNYYGVDDTHIAAYFLDPTKGQALIERQAAAAGYGGVAAQQNIGVSRAKAESWVDQGISADQVQTGISNAAATYDDLARMGKRYGETYTQDEAVDDMVGGLASARRKRQRISGLESATFGGSTGTASFEGRDTGGF